MVTDAPLRQTDTPKEYIYMFRICCTRFLIYYEVFIAARLELSTLAITTHPPSSDQDAGPRSRWPRPFASRSPRRWAINMCGLEPDRKRNMGSSPWLPGVLARTIRSTTDLQCTKRVELEENVPIQSCQHASKCACIGCIRL